MLLREIALAHCNRRLSAIADGRLAGQLQERVPSGIGIAAERLADGWRDWLDGLRGARAIAAGMTGYERLVSERALGHSKRLAELRGVVASHLVAADPQWRDVAVPAPGAALAAYGVRRIPPAIDVAGPCRLEVDGSRIDVARLEGLTRIPAAWASALASAAATATIAVVTTIENETSAWTYIEERGGPGGLAAARELVLYTSGFASTTGAEVLRLLHAAVPSARFRHWGDADPHGFRIWLDLARRSGAPLRWWRTTAAWVVAAAARQAGAPITAAERRALVALAKELPATDLDADGAATAAVAALLDAGCKIEQEAFEPFLDAS